MLDETVKPDEPKFIRYEELCFYCFGNCELCKIRFMCWSGEIELEPNPRTQTKRHVDEALESIAFGSVVGRIIFYAVVDVGGFRMAKYHGGQLQKEIYTDSKLLYLNKMGMVCCRKKPKPIHHVKNWNG